MTVEDMQQASPNFSGEDIGICLSDTDSSAVNSSSSHDIVDQLRPYTGQHTLSGGSAGSTSYPQQHHRQQQQDLHLSQSGRDSSGDCSDGHEATSSFSVMYRNWVDHMCKSVSDNFCAIFL